MRKKKEHSATGVPGAEDHATQAVVVRIIAARVRQPDDNIREARDKVAKQVVYAVSRGQLPPPGQGGFIFGEVIAWARNKRKWKEALSDLPTITKGRVELTMAKPSVSATGGELPESLAECQRRLSEAYERIAALENELREKTPAAARYEQSCETNRQNARRPKDKR